MKVEFFDSVEEADARLREAMKAADARVRPWQAAIGPGDCFVADSGEEDLLVFGEVLEAYAEPHLKHYRLCRCYSAACPEGEVGDVHVSTMLCVIDRGVFELARQHGWDVEEGQRPPPPAQCQSCRYYMITRTRRNRARKVSTASVHCPASYSSALSLCIRTVAS